MITNPSMQPALGLLGGAFPGPLGWAAALSVKFGGYVFAGIVLKKLYPAITAIPARIAAVRVGLGLALEPASFLGMMALLPYLRPNASNASFSVYFVAAIAGLRILVWALVIWLFLRKTSESRKYLWVNAAAGAVWSFMLDFPAWFLAGIAPGKITIC